MINPNESMFPNAIRVMNLRRRLEKFLDDAGLSRSQEKYDIIEELVSIEMELYKTPRMVEELLSPVPLANK